MRRPWHPSSVRKSSEASPHELPCNRDDQRRADQQPLTETLLIFEQVKIAQPFGRIKSTSSHFPRKPLTSMRAPDCVSSSPGDVDRVLRSPRASIVRMLPHHGGQFLNVTMIRVPCPGADSTLNSAPTTAARSRMIISPQPWSLAGC